MKYSALLLGLCLVLSSARAEDIKINWPKFFWPPFNTVEHDGYFDLQHRFVNQKLSGFSHHLIERLPPNRLVHYVSTDSIEAYCYWGIEDSDYFRNNSLYSAAVGYAPELQMVMTRQTRDRLHEKYGNPISLLDVLTDPEFTPAIEMDRPISEEMVKLISATGNLNPFKRLVTRADPFQKYQMVLRGRYPIVLENFIAFYWVQNNQPETAELVIEPFAEQTQFFSKYHVVCNRSEDSRRYIDAVNAVLAEAVHTSEFIELVKPFYDETYYQAYLKNAALLSKQPPQKPSAVEQN